MKKKTTIANDMKNFGDQLAMLRKARGMTQAELGEKIGVSKRIICYYEKSTKQPPSTRLHDLAKALKVPVDKLLGIKNPEETPPVSNKKVLKRLKQIDQLPQSDQNALIHYIDLLVLKHKSKSKPDDMKAAG